MQFDIDKLRKIIDSNKNFILTTHVNPDGDGLGSEIALALYLKSKGKDAAILNCSSTPENYTFLSRIFPVHRYDPPQHKSLIENTGVIIVLDTNHPDRMLSLGTVIKNSRAVKVCIDHHLEPGEFADLYILDEDASSTGEIVYNLLNMFGVKSIDIGTATSLYTAIMTDTGSFRYPKTDKEVHNIIGQLIDAGADPGNIYEEVYERGSENRTRLLGLALEGLKLTHEGRISHIVITGDMFESTGTTEEDIDAFAPYTLAINGVKIGLLFSEINGIVKVSFRSKGNIQINELAKEFGGNGHKNAAGARIVNGNLDELMTKILNRAGEYISLCNKNKKALS